MSPTSPRAGARTAAKSTEKAEQATSVQLATPLAASSYVAVQPADYVELSDLQSTELPHLQAVLTGKANAVMYAHKALVTAQEALTAAEGERDQALQNQATAVARSKELLASLAAFHLRVDPLVQSVQGARKKVSAQLINGDLPANLKVVWNAERVSIVPLEDDNLSAIVDARNVRAGSYSYGVSLEWVAPSTTTS